MEVIDEGNCLSALGNTKNNFTSALESIKRAWNYATDINFASLFSDIIKKTYSMPFEGKMFCVTAYKNTEP